MTKASRIAEVPREIERTSQDPHSLQLCHATSQIQMPGVTIAFRVVDMSRTIVRTSQDAHTSRMRHETQEGHM